MELQPGGQRVVISLIICFIISYIAVGLRMAARIKQKHRLIDSDWLILASLAVFTGYAGVLFSAVYNPTGDLNSMLPLDILREVFKKTFATQIIIGTCITLAKLSLLLLWRTIFIGRFFRIFNYAVMGVATAWWVGVTVALFLQCNPAWAAWDPIGLFEGAVCIPLGTIILGYEVANIFVDLLIVSVPVNEIRKLKMPTRKKIGIGCFFILGGFVIVTSAIRIHFTNINEAAVGGDTGIIDLPQTYQWTNIQLASTIVCACLATYPPLLPQSWFNILQAFTTWMRSLLSNRNSSNKSRRNYRDIDAVERGQDERQNRVVAGKPTAAMRAGDSDSIELMGLGQNARDGIHVQHDIEIVSTQR